MLEISGKSIKEKITLELIEEVNLLNKKGIVPTLVAILVGNDPASQVYIKNKIKTCDQIGIKSILKSLPVETSERDLLKLIDNLNLDQAIHGILCQVPLPKHINENKIIQSIIPKKDVDCFHPFNLGLLTSGECPYLPCTPNGIIELLKRYNFDISGKHMVILGRGNTVGKPLSILASLKGIDATVTICHSKTQNMKEICKTADIVVAAIGRAKFVTKDFLKKNAIVIDVGINRIPHPEKPGKTKLVGDVDYENIKEIALAATPVPGGVGPMTITMLMLNTIQAAKLCNQS